jgi:hypothetical protein
MSDDGVSGLIEYITISGILMVLFVITLITLTGVFIQHPLNQITYNSFIDIGNGMSTRMVDFYCIIPFTEESFRGSPNNLTITTNFDIPDEVIGMGYSVGIRASGINQRIDLSNPRGSYSVSLAGIGETMRVGGNTTSQGLNMISFVNSPV